MTTHARFHHLVTARHYAAIATAFLLPLSTSGQAIAVTVLAVLALVTLERRYLDALLQPAALIPVLLFLLLLIGVFWSTLAPAQAIKGLNPYPKLLLIPLLAVTPFTRREAIQIGYAFLAACLILLSLSLASTLWPSGPWGWFKSPGVPVKDNAVQSGCFALCAFGLAIFAIRIRSQNRRRALALTALALLFFADVFLIYLSKTGMVMAAALLGLVLIQAGGWRRAFLIGVPSILIVVTALVFSPAAQQRLAEISRDMNAAAGEETISIVARMDFWNKGTGFVKQAPVFGHGTGMIRPLYEAAEIVKPSAYGVTGDPHNQFLAIAIQLGLVGGLLLVAMWAAHFFLFVGQNPAGIFGLAVVIQNVIGSLFNSHLSTVTQGMLYCLAVGLLGGLVLRSKQSVAASSLDERYTRTSEPVRP